MNTFLDNWLLRRAMSAPRGGGGDDVVIPSVYQRVEWLKSHNTGAAYISTDITMPGNVDTILWEAKAGFWNQGRSFLSSWNDTSHNTYCEFNSGKFGFGGTYIPQDGGLLAGELYDVRFSLVHYYEGSTDMYALLKIVSNGDIYSATSAGFVGRSQNTFRVFGLDNNYTASDIIIGRNKLSFDGVAVLDLIPCYRKSDGKPGMWDMVGWKFYENAGSGADFTVGPDVVQPATKYIVFEDRAVEAICVQNFSSDGIGVTMQDAAGPFPSSVTDSLFKDNTQITSFEELQYFTGYTSQPIRRLTRSLFQNTTNLKRVIAPAGFIFDLSIFNSASGLEYVEFLGDPYIYYDDLVFYRNTNGLIIVFRGTNPPTFRSTCLYPNNNAKIYVPYSSDHSVYDNYQTILTNAGALSRGYSLYELNPDGTIPT